MAMKKFLLLVSASSVVAPPLFALSVRIGTISATVNDKPSQELYSAFDSALRTSLSAENVELNETSPDLTISIDLKATLTGPEPVPGSPNRFRYLGDIDYRVRVEGAAAREFQRSRPDISYSFSKAEETEESAKRELIVQMASEVAKDLVDEIKTIHVEKAPEEKEKPVDVSEKKAKTTLKSLEKPEKPSQPAVSKPAEKPVLSTKITTAPEPLPKQTEVPIYERIISTQITTAPEPISTPTAEEKKKKLKLTCFPSDSAIVLAWDKVENVKYYKLFKDSGDGFKVLAQCNGKGDLPSLLHPPEAYYIDEEVFPHHVYIYKVEAYTEKGTTYESPEVSVSLAEKKSLKLPIPFLGMFKSPVECEIKPSKKAIIMIATKHQSPSVFLKTDSKTSKIEKEIFSSEGWNYQFFVLKENCTIKIKSAGEKEYFISLFYK